MNILRPLITVTFLLLLAAGCSKPLFVTHLTPEGIAMTKKKGYGRPVHKTVFARVMCFDEKCRKKAAWAKRQRKQRFKGYDSGPSLPLRERGVYVKEPDTLLARKSAIPVKPVDETVTESPLLQPVKKDTLIVLNEVLFEVNSYHLKPGIYPKLDSIADFVLTNKNLTVKVSGHTDSSGGETHNQRLSENRAQVVARYLVEQGIPTAQVTFRGYGSSQPIDSNTTDEGKKRNRRVEILIHEDPR